MSIPAPTQLLRRAMAAPVLVTVTSCALIAVGLVSLWNHEQTAGVGNSPPTTWPADSSIPRETDRQQLLLFAHPHCPCFRATLAELERILAKRGDSATAVVAFYRPSSLPASWAETDTWRAARRIHGVRVMHDVDGVEARRFGAATSGMSLSYNTDGRLLFAGGITSSRGHEGPNDGAQFLTAAGRDDSPALTCSVYGCPLFPRTSPAK